MMQETKADTNNLIARTGRVQGWIDDPTSRLPVSCTVINVQDSMSDGQDSIEASWRFVSHALRYGAGVAVHLSDVRARGTEMVKAWWPRVQSRLEKSTVA